MIEKVRSHITQNESLLFEMSSPGKTGYQLPELDVPAVDAAAELGQANVRDRIDGFPEVSEVEAIRHFTRLSTWNYAIDLGLYPLGSCTMKYNPRVNELVARLDGLAWAHPYQPESLSQGAMSVIGALEQALLEITGMDAITLQPAAGAHGELTGILLIRALLEKRGNPRKRILIPDSAHGTNPATAAIAGYAVQNIRSNDHGEIDLEALARAVDKDVAAMMVTNPNTIGVFEQDIIKAAEILHAKGAMLYMDGANMNALVGIARPGDFGVDVMHINLHKTFSTPHGGGGPGGGPVAVKKALEPFLPVPRLRRAGMKWTFDYKRPKSIGRVRAFYGNFGVLVRALAYILAHGGDGLRNATVDAVMNANYIRKGLEPYFDLPYKAPNMHEVVFSDDRQGALGVHTGDMAKRLIDYGFHPYTVSFPLIVHGALMIEPTETESKQELDHFINAMISIAKEVESDPQLVKTAPHSTRTSKVDEVTAARRPFSAGSPRPPPPRPSDVKLLLVLAVVLLLRAPFLNQAIQGDDIYYLAGAQHAQIDPAHPINVKYVFSGELVDMEGHPHPPLNAWFLGLLLATFGDIREVPFHSAYVLFSIIAALSMWSLAQRFSPHPLWATLLFLATPAFVINGNSLESDIPFLAFWLAGVALFVAGRYALAAIALALAAMTAYQAVFLTPILAVYVWLFARRSKTAWAALMIPPIVIAGWQVFELFTVGKLPIAVLGGYFQTYELQSWAKKLRNAGALSMHACWIVFPALVVPAFLASRKRRDTYTKFLAAWIAIYFAAGIGIFFAGSARYLLPIAAPVALLVSRISVRWLAAGFAAQMMLSLSLASVNYQHWDGYRAFAASLKPQLSNRRVWINGEWVRYYLEAEGALPIVKEQSVRAGDLIVTSDLGYPVHFTAGGGALTPIAQRDIGAILPLRLIGLNTRSAYSTADRGVLPFDIAIGPIDRVRAEVVVERQPKLEYLSMDAPDAEQQLVSGVYALEGKTRWMARQAVILLKSPVTPSSLRVTFYTPSPRRVSLLLDGKEVANQIFDAPGRFTIQSPAPRPGKPITTLTIVVDKTISVRGDNRELGIVLSEAGFVP